MSNIVDCIVIGGGVVGLAIARELQLSGREVYVLEANSKLGQETSARSSEVVHAGIYYKKQPLKNRLCQRGRRLLYGYCEQRGVRIKKIGKLVVASNDTEVAALEQIATAAVANGVNDLVFLTKHQAESLEPALQVSAGLLSPSSGVVDSVGLLTALSADFEAAGGQLVTRSAVIGGAVLSEGIALRILHHKEPIVSHCVINAAGLHAPAVARSIDGVPSGRIPNSRYAIGHYYQLPGPLPPFSRLVYPVPADGGLGIHFTLSVNNEAKFGPDVRWRSQIDYRFDDSLKAQFVENIAKYFPAIYERELVPAHTGIRPKIADASGLINDFVIEDSSAHSVKGLINLFGIESPGLTAALAIGEEIRARLDRRRELCP